jgi:2-dehydropantoate 2-reductase
LVSHRDRQSDGDQGRNVRILIVGAGAIGSLYGAKLSSHHDVTLVGRPDHVHAIQTSGLRLQGHQTGTFRVRATTYVDAIAPGTLLILTTKVSDTHAAVAPLVSLLPTDSTILCLQNGLYSENLVKDLVGPGTVVLRGIVQFGAILREPGVIDFTVAGHTLIEQHPRAAVIARAFTESGLDGRVTADIKTEMWRKLVFNCVINPITSILGTEVGGIADPRLDPLKQLVVEECLAVARADGVTFDDDFLRVIADLFGLSRNVASMRQDLLKGRKTEIDHLNGGVVALGVQYGIDCPVNAALTAIVKRLERQRGRVMSSV